MTKKPWIILDLDHTAGMARIREKKDGMDTIEDYIQLLQFFSRRLRGGRQTQTPSTRLISIYLFGISPRKPFTTPFSRSLIFHMLLYSRK